MTFPLGRKKTSERLGERRRMNGEIGFRARNRTKITFSDDKMCTEKSNRWASRWKHQTQVMKLPLHTKCFTNTLKILNLNSRWMKTDPDTCLTGSLLTWLFDTRTKTTRTKTTRTKTKRSLTEMVKMWQILFPTTKKEEQIRRFLSSTIIWV